MRRRVTLRQFYQQDDPPPLEGWLFAAAITLVAAVVLGSSFVGLLKLLATCVRGEAQ